MLKRLNKEKLLVGGGILTLAVISWLLVILDAGPTMGMPSLPIEANSPVLLVAIWMVAITFPTAVLMC